MIFDILRSKKARRITSWKLSSGEAAPNASRAEATEMENTPCSCIKQEICSGVYWVTNDCNQGVKEGFRPRVAFSQTCANCPSHREMQQAK